MYVHVLCPSHNLLLSRIWVHLPRLEGDGERRKTSDTAGGLQMSEVSL